MEGSDKKGELFREVVGICRIKGKRMRCQECAASSKFGLRELEGDGNDGHKGGSLEVPFDFGRYLEEKD